MKKIIILCLLPVACMQGYLKYIAQKLKTGHQITDFSGMDLRGMQFTDFSGLILQGVNFHNVRAQVCTLTDKNKNVKSMICDPTLRTNFTGLDLSGADLSSSDFSSAVFSKANLAKTNLQHSSFRFVDFTGAHFEGATIGHTDFTGANFTGAIGLESVMQADTQCIFTCATMPDGTVCTPGTKEWKSKDASGKEISIPCNCPDPKKIKGDAKTYCTTKEFTSAQNIQVAVQNALPGVQAEVQSQADSATQKN
jgi:uncharacterized protein YjbI with pentapeptide repeats